MGQNHLVAELFETTISKLVHGGQGLGSLPDGRKAFIWNALPGETVRARIIKQKQSYAEAIAEEIIVAAPERIEPQEANYLATSPWQIITYPAENQYKKAIVEELFGHEKLTLPALDEVIHGSSEWHYRNKMEYSFWGDDDGLHLALHQRGSHGKQIVTGSQLAMPAVDAAANAICMQLSALNARAGDLKTIIVRCSQPKPTGAIPLSLRTPGSSQKSKTTDDSINTVWIPDQVGNDGVEAVGALFVKLESFKKLELPSELKGLRVYYSNPQSPASVPTKLLYELGNCTLTDDILGQQLSYDVDSFFQVNVPVFEQALAHIKQHCQDASLTDMYAGVGSIGLSVASERLNLIEFDKATAAMARVNAEASKLQVDVVEGASEKVLEYISGAEPIIFDPPRAGLHKNIIGRLLEVRPAQIIYLSCNPATQARDLKLLEEAYDIEFLEIYNFFPRTPHIETLAILKQKA